MFRRTKGKVFVGLSGGVDSAVSAALLQQQGYDVTGVFIRIALPGYPCSAGADRIDAMRVAAHLKIPFLEIDLSEEYRKQVFKTAIGEFTHGRTPNPDTLCNREIKFGAFFDFAMEYGADFVATGHYAQTKDGLLYAGKDPSKDQSYFLWMVRKEILEKTMFPVGNLEKTEVRKLADTFGLPNARRKDSQGLCFLGDISIEDMLHKELAPVPGDVLSEDGEVIGRHDGAPLYTLGQRHGFVLASQSPDTKAHFVIEKDVEFNTITVSTERFPKGVTKTEVSLIETNWIGELQTSSDFVAQYRYHQTLIPAEIVGESQVVLQQPHYMPLGQSLVLYTKEGRCLGGGIVDKSALIS
ncbi:tRNA 2-thiouridine(34) synthase MnmA [Candidatus Adlerbacteria bacterium RIFOXYC1_FULL_48_26]|uniref:tRNA-specific 2-thiouridylase MnmA n=1 Tax=Candidatus Adlerbacteria bacterium RIFOXYC1_FULL_48_26 TaxID=1797247 RepID=A0A1F4Y3I3_9BACT|nr:MAG: tRNA 2-thiouridine(34) synthase MnmA [Candidatus Adlerbacteria bacterium RIFOXYC1_FULL_48_26]OGC93857.1 MAG: tRNA 2-thiouridine(34) synthase MnmA [Candidatus Adlerbacteria bacterium RIFOXYB1_FULL_48_10]OGC95853.1 MAG: tRNA 2-thiouridine(34) synthase MnmA [Candidatus Adlerbacteria bacterium RIFOXYD1_FULL_48_8]